MTEARGWYVDRKGARYAYVPLGGRKKKDVRLVTCTTDEQAATRARVIRELAAALRDAGKDSYLDKVVEDAATAAPERLASIQRIVAGIVSGVERPTKVPSVGTTWGDVARRWTSGELHRLYPDRVPKKKSVRMDRARVKELEELVGDVLITDPAWLDHAEEAMRRLPERVQTTATRRQYAQCIRRVLELAVLPLRLIPANPLPRGFLPKIRQHRALQMPYPDEDAKLMAAEPTTEAAGVPLVHRLAYGFLARMGFRKSEIFGGADEEGYEDEEVEPAPPLTWDRLDLDRGVVFRARSKTDVAVPIVLDAGVCRALAVWKKLRPPPTPNSEVFVDERGAVLDLGTKDFRADLLAAGVDRAELHVKTQESLQVRVHDLRALFVTTSLANGRPESWVRDRTSHRTVSMLDKYRRQARLFAELHLGDLRPLDEAIPELARFGHASDDGPKEPEPPPKDVKSLEETAPSVPLAPMPQTFDSSYEGSNPSVGTNSYEIRGEPSEASSEAFALRSAEVDARLAKLAAKARMLERLATGDVRLLAEEIREGLEALCGPRAEVVDIAARRGVK